MKLDLQNKWSKVSDYLTDGYYSLIAGKWSDAKIEVVGDKYIIFTVGYYSLISGIYSNVKLSDEFINTILGNKYYYVVISDEEWIKYKNEYINNIRNGIKYSLRELKENNDENIEIKNEKQTTIVDRLFDIVGEENIEFK